MADVFDYILLVTAPEAARRKRLSAKVTASEFSRRAARQLPEPDKAARSDFVVENVGGRERPASGSSARCTRRSWPRRPAGAPRRRPAERARAAPAADRRPRPRGAGARLGPALADQAGLVPARRLPALARRRHPRGGSQEPARSRPGGRRDLRGEPLSRRRELAPGRGRPHAGPALDRPGHRPHDGGHGLRRDRPDRRRASTSSTGATTCASFSTTTTAPRRLPWPPTTPARATSMRG